MDPIQPVDFTKKQSSSSSSSGESSSSGDSDSELQDQMNGSVNSFQNPVEPDIDTRTTKSNHYKKKEKLYDNAQGMSSSRDDIVLAPEKGKFFR